MNGRNRRHPIHISYPEMKNLGEGMRVGNIIFLICDESCMLPALEEQMGWYAKRLPGAKMICLPREGGILPALGDRYSIEREELLYALREIAPQGKFGLVVMNHEGCLHNVRQGLGKEDEYCQAIAIRELLPAWFLEELEDLRWVSFYDVETNGKVGFRGRYF